MLWTMHSVLWTHLVCKLALVPSASHPPRSCRALQPSPSLQSLADVAGGAVTRLQRLVQPPPPGELPSAERGQQTSSEPRNGHASKQAAAASHHITFHYVTCSHSSSGRSPNQVPMGGSSGVIPGTELNKWFALLAGFPPGPPGDQSVGPRVTSRWAC
jgi:hypothetical protein